MLLATTQASNWFDEITYNICTKKERILSTKETDDNDRVSGGWGEK